MAPPPDGLVAPTHARLFLAHPPLERSDGGHLGERLELPAEELEHARARRLRVEDRCEGLDGFGTRWPLVVRTLDHRRLVVEVAGEPRREPGPGTPGAPLPWIELAVAWPRRARGETLIGGLTQLGVAAITPLEARFRGPEPVPSEPPERWGRLAREALKQSGRTWLPELSRARTLEALLEARPAAAVATLDPRAPMPFDTWLRSLVPGSDGAPGSPTRPLLLCIGPEGGFAPEELDLLRLAGATPVWLGPHVLRVETAALAAAAVAATVMGSPPR